MKILVFNRQKDVLLRTKAVRAIVEDVLGSENVKTDEISIHLVSIEEICHLHHEFFNDSSPTDCISFSIDNLHEEGLGFHVLGEVFICPQVATTYQDVYQELSLYLIHGLLHLIGYDDIDEIDRMAMRLAEKNHMQRLLNKKLLLKGA